MSRCVTGADEGLSGTSIKRRPQFAEMLRLALEGEIDLILTKEVSRFARNTVDTLQVTRQLKERGVGVIFLNDNIDTRDNDGEFRLTIMASVAQEESRKISERTRWGQRQAMKRGVVFGNNSIYGFNVCGGRLTVHPEQAEVVRAIYRAFLEERKGTHTIAGELTRGGVRPPLRASGSWSSTMVLNILRNEKYCGDLLQQKYRTIDYLSHRKIVNRGEEEQILLRGHHEAIVSRAQFEAVQEELARRAATGKQSRFSARYWYSGKVRCAACGRSFILKRTRRGDGTEYSRFVCRGRLDPVVNCPMRAVRGEVVRAAALRALQEVVPDRDAIIAKLLDELRAQRRNPDGAVDSAEKLREAIARQVERKDRALDAFLDGDLNRADMQRITARCDGEIRRFEERLAGVERKAREPERGADRFDAVRALLERELSGGDAVLDEVIRRITVYPDCFQVEAAEVPVPFRVCAQGSGTGPAYKVTVTECTPLAGPPLP